MCALLCVCVSCVGLHTECTILCRRRSNITSPQVVISTPEGYVIGTVSSVYTFCRSVFIATNKAPPQPSPQTPTTMPMAVLQPSLPLPNVSLKGPVDLPFAGGANVTPDDVWEAVNKFTWQLRRTPGECASQVHCCQTCFGVMGCVLRRGYDDSKGSCVRYTVLVKSRCFYAPFSSGSMPLS